MTKSVLNSALGEAQSLLLIVGIESRHNFRLFDLHVGWILRISKGTLGEWVIKSHFGTGGQYHARA